MPEFPLRQPRFTYSASGPFTKKKERIRKFEETGNSRHFYQNELDKVCLEHDISSGDFKGLARRKASDKVLRNKAFNVAKSSKYDGYQRSPISMVHNFFDKKTSGSRIKNKNMSDRQLADELHKAITRKSSTITFCRQYLRC